MTWPMPEVAALAGVVGPPLAGVGFLAVLLWLAVHDLRTRRLPDRVVLPALWAGLVLNALGLGPAAAAPGDAVLGAASGWLALRALSALWSLRRPGVAALGGGDLKAAAMIGAWVGASALPGALLVAFVAGALATLPALATGRRAPDSEVPFGPALALGGAVSLAAGPGLGRALFGFA